MPNKWRPEGWYHGGGKYNIDPEGNKIGTQAEDDFEDGADAMLEALRKMPYGGYRLKNEAPDGVPRIGKMVFIPDDAEEKGDCQ